MMGQLPAQQNALFYEFCLENHIPDDTFSARLISFSILIKPVSTLTPFITIPEGHRLILSL